MTITMTEAEQIGSTSSVSITSEPIQESPRQLGLVEELRQTTFAVRLRFVPWFGVRRSFTKDQRLRTASEFQAEEEALGGCSKKILDPKHPALKGVRDARAAIERLWISLAPYAYPEDRIRLGKRSNMVRIDYEIRHTREALLLPAIAAANLEYPAMKLSQPTRMGQLHNPHDYPVTLDGAFGMELDYPPLQPPEYLREHPHIYEAQLAGFSAKLGEALAATVDGVAGQLSELMDRFLDSMTPGADGKRKVFKGAPFLDSVRELVDGFKALPVTGSVDLENVIRSVEQVVAGVDPKTLNKDVALRAGMAAKFAGVKEQLDKMIVDAPARVIRVMKPAGAMKEAE